ncbi:MAG: Smr/MutS family protein [Pseudomonadota bacterium]
MCEIFAGQPAGNYESETRSMRLNGHCTSIRLERLFWRVLGEIAEAEGTTVPQFVSKLHAEVTGVLRKGAGHGGQGSGSATPGAARPAWAGVLREGDAPPRPVGRPEAGLDRRTAERLRRGEREPDARIDLHGMTAERAHRALDRFIGAAASSGARVVLVITGKGGRHAPQDAPWLPPGRGVLRDAAPRWLRQGTHGHRILGIYEAHLRHGGAGAFYVYLKKPR